MARVALIGVVAAVGCNRIFDIDTTKLDVPPDGPGCSGASFSAGAQAYAAPPNTPLAVAVRGDELELVYREFATSKLVRATRVSTEEPFGPGVELAAPAPSDDDPSLMRDGQRLAFVSDRLGRPGVFESVRTAAGYELPVPIALPFATTSAALSFDGLSLYAIHEPVPNEPTELWVFTRDRFDDPFGSPRMVYLGYMIAPTLSPDGLEVYFHDSRFPPNQVLRLTRQSATDAFDSAAVPQIVVSGTNPYVADSGELLIYVDLGMIRALRRACSG